MVDTKATTGAWIVRNQIGAAVPGYPWTAGTGVEVRGGTDGVVAYNDIARQRIGLRLFLPVLQVDNRFQDNGQDVVGP